MSTSLRPVGEGDRLDLLDVLRGFAVLGILLVNFWGEDDGTRFERLDAFMSQALGVLISGSFYPLFSFLFGLGFAVQLARARTRGTGSSLLYLRRMLALFLIGTVHAVLIWDGDILVAYSILGLALIPLHRLGQKAILLLVVAMFVAGLNAPAIRAWQASAGAQRSEVLIAAARGLEDRIENNRVWPSEDGEVSYAETVRRNWAGHMRDIRGRTNWLNWMLSDILLYFLIGLLVGRSRVLHEIHGRRRAVLMVWGVAAIVGIGGAVTRELGWFDSPGWLGGLGYQLANPGLTAFYVLTITFLYTFTARGRRAFGVFAPAGRMALTNYGMQSVVMTSMSESYGFGWTPSTTAWIAINLLFFFAVQVPLSRWWLGRFNYGPAEWLWRSLTYGAVQAFRSLSPAPSS